MLFARRIRPHLGGAFAMPARHNEIDKMNTNLSLDIELMDGRSFILGREGHIYLDSPTASKHHAEISIDEGKVYLRDLGSTNGTFLLKDKRRVRFEAGYVSLLQPIVIGKRIYVIQDLLSIASDFAAVDDHTTRVELPEEWKKNMAGE
ncbi:MAG: FHA domain-containing protein [Gammaproteobacteria bacterium]|nr:FHA domain-containing protein [Gammaproteobacteria bacterium]